MRFPHLTGYLEHWANHLPDRLFLRSSDQQLTYAEAAAEVDRRAQAVAPHMEQKPVILTGNNSIEWVLQMLAVLKTRVPVVLLPAAMTEGEAKRFITLCGSRLQIEGSTYKRPPASAEHDRSDVFLSSGASLAFPTSGSTGAIKLVLRSAESLVDEGERYLKLWTLTPEDTVMAVLPLSHAYVLGAALAGTLVSGCTLWTSHFVSHRTLAAEICSSKTTVLPLVRPIAQALALGDAGAPISSHLRIAMVGASPIVARTVGDFHARWGIWLSQNYGSAETGATLASFYPESIDCTGSPLPHVECALVPDNARRGQLWIKLQAPPLGYLTQQGWDCTKLSPDQWWATGDVFSRDSKGNFVFSERMGSWIRRGGRNIQPREVEDVLREHPSVKDVCVIGAQDLDGQERVEAYVQPQPGSAPSVSELREHLRSRISEFKIPTQWTISGEMPLTWSGKVDVQSIRKQSQVPAAPDWTRQLMSYRISEAILVAESLGLIERLARSPEPVEILAQELELDPELLKIFLAFLENAGFIRQSEQRWSLAVTLPREWEQICSLERELRQSWLSGPALEQALRSRFNARSFDRGVASSEFASIYSRAVCGPALTLSVQHLLRILKPAATANIMEIGRGVGCFSKALSGHTGKMRILPVGPSPAILYPEFQHSHGTDGLEVMRWEQIKPERGECDLIVLLNCIHWITPEEFTEVFTSLVSGLATGGTLAVLDSFLADEQSSAGISFLFLLDWITHGGCFWLSIEELMTQLRNSGLEKIEVRSFPNLQQRWVLAKPAQYRPDSEEPTLERLQHQGA